MECDTPPNMSVNSPCLAISADYDVYPNIAEPAEWWRLGNLKTDGIHKILRNYFNPVLFNILLSKPVGMSVLCTGTISVCASFFIT
jgi:hypothetical protein